jgi:hypothetical protein
VRPPPTSATARKALVQPQALAGSNGGRAAYCAMHNSVPSTESCSSSSSSDTSGSEAILASPPPILNLRISVELSEPEAEAVQHEVPVEMEACVAFPKS